jgi:hypothetical protein
MKKFALLTLGILASATIAGAASAADGCGPGFHRNPWGHCRANGPRGANVVMTPHGLVVGTYYPHHGYWDGQRYWWHRYHDRDGGWRYR